MSGSRLRPGRALGIDLGTRRIGIAVSDSAGTMALPRTTLFRTGDAEGDRRRLVDLILEEEAVVVVIGLPLSLDGSHGPAATVGVGRSREPPGHARRSTTSMSSCSTSA